jgi:hypothetical protein
MAYIFQRPAKDGKVRFTAMYKAKNGKYRSAGTSAHHPVRADGALRNDADGVGPRIPG